MYMAYYKIDGYWKKEHPLYWTYQGMLSRCYKKNGKDYKDYGGRGIKVVARWRGEKGFEHFIKDMGKKPVAHTLDRINNNRWYSPKNCRWADLHTQAVNRRNSRNKSGYTGVSLYKATNRWLAYIDLPRIADGKKNRKYLGYFDDLADAIDARKFAEKQLEVQHNKES